MMASRDRLRAGEGIDAQNAVAEIKIRAERRAGQLLKGIEKLKGRPSKALHRERLSDVGVTEIQSHRWQSMASSNNSQGGKVALEPPEDDD